MTAAYIYRIEDKQAARVEENTPAYEYDLAEARAAKKFKKQFHRDLRKLLTDTEYKLYCALEDWAEGKGYCWQSQTTISEECNISVRAINYAAHKLVYYGLIMMDVQQGVSNVYWVIDPRKVCVPPLHQMQDTPARRADPPLQDVQTNVSNMNVSNKRNKGSEKEEQPPAPISFVSNSSSASNSGETIKPAPTSNQGQRQPHQHAYPNSAKPPTPTPPAKPPARPQPPATGTGTGTGGRAAQAQHQPPAPPQHQADPTMQHHAVISWHEMYLRLNPTCPPTAPRSWPNPVQRQQIVAGIPDNDRGRSAWPKVLNYWAERGYRLENVADMIDLARHGPRKQGQGQGQGQRAGAR